MRQKTAITVLLLLFVGASVVTLIVKETGSAPDEQATGGTTQIQPKVAQSTEAKAPIVTVYYFYGNVRCPTCHKLENYTSEAVTANFAKDLEAGTLVWKLVNVDESANQHYIQKYNLFTKSVIISESIDGQETRWVNLDRIWDLVSAKDEYLSYIETELKTFLGRE